MGKTFMTLDLVLILGYDPKAGTTAKINKWDYVKLQNFCDSMDFTKVKKHTGENICKSYI
jgi:hypothetical protein